MSILTIILVLAVIGLCYAFNYYKNEERRRMTTIKQMWNEVKENMPSSDKPKEAKETTVEDLDPVVRRAKERVIEERNLRTAVDDEKPRKPRTAPRRPPSRRKSHMSKPRTPMSKSD